jgi:hypothetical protein
MAKRIELSSGQQTQAGYVLDTILYSNFIECLLTHKEWIGCPHNGGMHSLVLFLSKEEAHLFIDLCEEEISKACGEERFKKFISGLVDLRGKIDS